MPRGFFERMGSSDPIIVNLSNCRYEVVKEAVKSLGFTVSEDESDDTWTIFFVDKSSAPSRVQKLRDYQMINHFPSIGQVSKRENLSVNMKRLKLLFPEEYAFYPKSFLFPSEREDLEEFLRKPRSLTSEHYIVKPIGRTCGRGFFVSGKDVIEDCVNLNQKCVVQEYIERPLLIDGRKIDLRVYLLITSVKPLQLYIFRNGFVRLAIEKFKIPHPSNIKNNNIHISLSGYSSEEGKVQNKRNGMFGEGYLRDFVFLKKWWEENAHDIGLVGTYDQLFKKIGEVLVKSFLCGYPQIKESYEKSMTGELGEKKGGSFTCFEILGCDVMIDCADSEPKLVGMIHSPSHSLKGSLDHEVKLKLLQETFKLLAVDRTQRKNSLKREKLQKNSSSRYVSQKEMSSVAQHPREYEVQRRKDAEMKCRTFLKVFPTVETVRKLSGIIREQRVEVELDFAKYIVENSNNSSSSSSMIQRNHDKQMKNLRTLLYDRIISSSSSSSHSSRIFAPVINNNQKVIEKKNQVIFNLEFQKKELYGKLEREKKRVEELTLKCKHKDIQINNIRLKISEVEESAHEERNNLIVEAEKTSLLEHQNLELKESLKKNEEKIKQLQIKLNEFKQKKEAEVLEKRFVREKERIEKERITTEILIENDFGEYCEIFIRNKVYKEMFPSLCMEKRNVLQQIIKNRIHFKRFIHRFGQQPPQQQVLQQINPYANPHGGYYSPTSPYSPHYQHNIQQNMFNQQQRYYQGQNQDPSDFEGRK